MKTFNMTKENWIAGVSRGLVSPCKKCGKPSKFNYLVDDIFWYKVVDKKDIPFVICLPCLDKMATSKGLDISKHLINIQFTGIRKTVELIPNKIFYY